MPERPNLAGLFGGFFGIGIIGFGGVLPWARRMVVDRQRWLDAAEFTDLLALCQFLPGPNIVNMAVALGQRYHGLPGSIAALSGLLAAPTAIVLALGGLYSQYGQRPVVAHAFTGLAAAASALVVVMAIRVARPIMGDRAAMGMAVLTFVAVALLRVPLLLAMLVLAPIAVVVCRRFPR